VRRLERLLSPRSIAVLGGLWADRVVEANRALGFSGVIYRIHPARTGCLDSIQAVPESVDAAFVGVAAAAVPEVACQLHSKSTGGFVCFASGFEEAGNAILTCDLVKVSRDMPFLGTNCYGFINYFDGVALWADQVVPQRPERGVAVITQSGAIAHGVGLSRRSLPLGYLISAGNQTSVSVADLIEDLSQDTRVSAFGLYLEGIPDLDSFRSAVVTATRAGKSIAVIKGGLTDWSREAAIQHTGASGINNEGFDRLCSELGIARCHTVATLIETLKLLHMGGPLKGNRVLALAASGGYGILTADLARTLPLEFSPLPARTRAQLLEILGPRVVLSNPLDFQTLHWHDPKRMRAMFRALFEADYDAIAFMFGYPPRSDADTVSYDIAVDEFIALAHAYRTRAIILAPLPEFCSDRLREKCATGGVVPLQGHLEGLEAMCAPWRLATAKPRALTSVPTENDIGRCGDVSRLVREATETK
jgi:acetate---CoA ligase (ADP-forming)